MKTELESSKLINNEYSDKITLLNKAIKLNSDEQITLIGKLQESAVQMSKHQQVEQQLNLKISTLNENLGNSYE